MKKLTIVAMGLGCMFAWGCKKTKNSIPDVIQPRGIHARINGVAWTATQNPPNVSSVSGTGSYYLQFDGYDTVYGRVISMILSNFNGKGTLNITNSTAANANTAYFLKDTSAGYEQGIQVNATTGTVTITMLNDTAVGGTFSFTAGSYNVTEGTFNVNY